MGDSSTPVDSGTDVATDTTVTNDAAPDVHVDAGPTCILPDATPGSLDLSFNTGVKTVGSVSFYARAAAVGSGGDVYVVGSTVGCTDAGWDLAIIHVLQDGSIDPVFAPNGKPRCLDFAVEDYGFGATMLASNNPLFGGSSGNGSTVGFASMVSLTSDGGFNKGFNLTGELLSPPSTGTVVGSGCGSAGLSDTSNTLTTINALAVSSTGKIAVAGSNTVNVCTPNTIIALGTAGFVYQLNSDGTPDSAFNGGAPIKDTTVGGYYGVAYDASGNIVVIGQNVADAGPSYVAAVRRYSATGSADGTLDVTATGGFVGRSVAVLPGGNVMIAGSSNLIGGTMAGALTAMRLTNALALDSSFNGGAPLTLPLAIDSYLQYSSLEVLCNGAVLAAATLNTDSGTDPQDMALVKLTPAGALDTSFGQGGIASATINGAEIPVGVAQDPTTGKVIVIGRDTTPHLVIARFNP